jgi:hypothetical protein
MSINVMTLVMHSVNREPVYIPALRCSGYISGRGGHFVLHVRECGPIREGEREYDGSGHAHSSLWKCVELRLNTQQCGFVAKVGDVCISSVEDANAP